MRIISASEIRGSLNFQPLKPWPRALPAMAAGGYQICGFGHTHSSLLHLDGALPSILDSIYGDLTWAELARLVTCLRSLELNAVAKELLSLPKYGACREQIPLLLHLGQLPLEFQNWASRKLISLKELSPLGLVPKELQETLNTEVLRSLASKNPTKSLGVEILEWGVELTLMGSKEVATNTAETVETWQKRLKRLRFQETLRRDKSREDRVGSVNWPSKVQAKWIRSGDQAGVEVRFTAHSKADFEKHVSQLSGLGETVSDIWGRE